MKTISILGICGSLRKDSFNRAALNVAATSAPKSVDIDIFEDLSEIPPFDQDVEQNMPDVILGLKEKIQHSDAILFATPEYNYSFPGVLKNAIDWASRPYGQSAWEGKPVAIMSASGGMLGGARAQYQLRQVFVFLNMHPLNKPEVIIPFAAEKIDTNGKITDTHTKEKIQELVEALVTWTLELQTGKKIMEEKAEKSEYERAYGRIGL